MTLQTSVFKCRYYLLEQITLCYFLTLKYVIGSYNINNINIYILDILIYIYKYILI